MLRRFAELLRRDDGGIATYVAQAVMVVSVLGVALLVIAMSSNLGRFIVDRVYSFMTHAPK